MVAAQRILLRRASFCLSSAKQSLEFLASKLAEFAGREAGDALEGGAEVAVAGKAGTDSNLCERFIRVDELV